ncbi:hypothetical protein Ga0100231_020280 [Opitutaceae bacterium TAV4]|nr:hypothetical protein Ga0100231_020280 [Opitutaceae bacterium TAV4]RRK01213.1 hypothetical protein Ga0100230_021085 [Opitutaceae bacterium TAV3]RRK02840.1 hypothetical protein Ga0100230_004370 [Opitutaceae bacterium TAV3]
MVCPDGRGLLLHASALEGGHIWLRARASSPDGVVVERSVYGGARGFDWEAAAEGIVEAWVAGGESAA